MFNSYAKIVSLLNAKGLADCQQLSMYFK